MLILVSLVLSGCLTTPGPVTEENEPEPDARADADGLTGRFKPEPASDHRHRTITASELEALPCPAPPPGNAKDRTPALQVALDPGPWPQGEWRCLTVVMNNTSDQVFHYGRYADCQGVDLRIVAPERLPGGPVTIGSLDTLDKTSCTVTTEPRSLAPGERFVERFYWHGSIVWAAEGPFVEPGTYTLAAGLEGRSSWDINTTVSFEVAPGAVAPTFDCSRNGEPDTTPRTNPRTQVLAPNQWPEDAWVCIEAVFLNTSNETYRARLDEYEIEHAIHAEATNNRRLRPATGAEGGLPMVREFEIVPGEEVTTVRWWWSGMGHPGTYRLRADFQALTEGTWDTEGTAEIEVVPADDFPTGSFHPGPPPRYHQKNITQERLDAIDCPPPPPGEDSETPRIQVALDPMPWPRGAWRCITVVFNNTSDKEFRHAGFEGCPELGVLVIDPEGTGGSKLSLQSGTAPPSCGMSDPEVVPPGGSVVEHFYWHGSMVWANDGPFVETGDITLFAFVRSWSSWDVATSTVVRMSEGDVAPTRDCRHLPEADLTPQPRPRTQILAPDAWSEDTWTCLEGVFVNTSDETFRAELSGIMRIEVSARDRTNETRGLMPVEGYVTDHGGFVREEALAPGEDVRTVLWWPPGLGGPGTYRLTADIHSREEGTWETAGSTMIEVLRAE